MVASQKRRYGSSSEHGASGSTLSLLIGGVLLVGVFFLGLNWGGKSEGQKSSVSANELHHREDALREQMQECKVKESRLIDTSNLLDDTAADIKSRNVKLDDRNRELHEEHNRQEGEIAKCQEETETQTAIFFEEDEARKRQIQAATEELEGLKASLQELTNGFGMRSVLLSASLERQKSMYSRLVKLLGDASESTTEDLVKKHEAALRGRIENKQELRSQKVEEIVANWTHWRYDPKNHTDIFLDTVDSDGEVIRPRYFDRSGSAPVKVLPRKVTPPLAVASLSSRITQLYDFAMCAMELSNPNFTFPNTFYWHLHVESDRSSLSSVIDTPLVTFCEQCFNRRRSLEFRIACDEEIKHVPYGGHEFWRARSLVRFQPSVEHEADNFMFANGLKGKRYLAVVMHSSHETLEACEKLVTKLPRNHYLYVRGNFDEKAPQLTADVDLQCSPTWERIVERIKQVLKEDEDETPYDAIYLSIEPESMERVRSDDLPGFNDNIVMMEQKNVFDEAVDMVVASRASRILVSPFLPTSQVVTELFLLRNHLAPSHRVHFF